jgi:hypothetical protein
MAPEGYIERLVRKCEAASRWGKYNPFSAHNLLLAMGGVLEKSVSIQEKIWQPTKSSENKYKKRALFIPRVKRNIKD